MGQIEQEDAMVDEMQEHLDRRADRLPGVPSHIAGTHLGQTLRQTHSVEVTPVDVGSEEAKPERINASFEELFPGGEEAIVDLPRT